MAKQQKVLKSSAQMLIEKYEKLCETYKDDEDGLSDALWEESIEQDDIEKARIRLSEKDPEIEKLEKIQEQLRGHKDTGIAFSTELEASLNTSVKQWKSKLDSSCQVIEQSSIEALIEKLEQRKEKLAQQIGPLKEKEESLKVEAQKAALELEKVKEFSQFYTENASAYMVIGLPPDHQVSLPLAVNGQRGLHPLAMLQKMSELVTGGKPFDLQTHNCSLTSIEVLTAGASHDPLLKSIMGERSLGFFGTPQQVLENAKLARSAISENHHSDILTRLSNFRPLDIALGKAMEIYMDPYRTKGQQNVGLFLAALVGVAKLPGLILSSLVNPKEKFNDLLYNLGLVFERNSTGLKVGVILLAIPALIVLTPLAAIQKGLEVVGQTLAKPFQYIANLMKPKPVSDEITAPVGSTPQIVPEGSNLESRSSNDSSYNSTMLAGILNSKIKSKIDQNTVSIEYQKSPEKLIAEFEKKLIENPQKIVVLSPKAHDSVDLPRDFQTKLN